MTSAVPDSHPRRGIFARNRWLIARRISQFGILGLFMLGPMAGIWVIEGNLASSNLLDTLDLTDPFIVLQSLAAGHVPETAALTGAVIVTGVYLLVGGRAYCGWVCPINVVTDSANFLRDKLGIRSNVKLQRSTRLWLIPVVLLVCALTTSIAWEAINPITMLQRGLVFGLGFAWITTLAVFLFDLLVTKHGWCGYLCPVGAAYGVIGKASVLRVSATARSACTDCGDCFRVCPEPQVIATALYPENEGFSPLITNSDCINCGRCMDVCDEDVFKITHRFDHHLRSTEEE